MGVYYRRIPVLSIGRDIFLDSRLIIRKLENLAPDRPRLTADANPEAKILERLFETLVMDTGLVRYVVNIVLTGSSALSNAAFVKDRMDLIGDAISFSEDALVANKPEATNEVKKILRLLETTLLADGRQWSLNTETPSLAGIEMAWPLHWLFSTPESLPEEQISSTVFPKVFGWVERLQITVIEREGQLPKPQG